MSEYGPIFRRFWYVIAAGACVGLLAVLAAVYDLPSLDKRASYQYTATARLLVTGDQAPYIRSSVTRTVQQQGREGATTSEVIHETPDLTPYIRAANLYPLLIESDEVQRYRTRLFGPMEGVVTASAIYQVATAARFRPSEIPVLQVFGTAATQAKAIKLSQSTSAAFIRWIALQQKQSKVPAAQRISLLQLEQPKARDVTRDGGTATGLLILLFGAIVAASGLLAIVLDRLWPDPSGRATGEVAAPAALRPETPVEAIGPQAPRRSRHHPGAEQPEPKAGQQGSGRRG